MPPRNRSRSFCFTLNNYTESEIRDILACLEAIEARYVFQEETSATGTPHLQGVLNAKHQIAQSTLRTWNLRIHWECTRDIHTSVRYCSNPDKRTGRIWSSGFTVPGQDLQLLDPQNLYPWQQQLAARLGEPPEPRSIIWYYDPHGNSGKTAFVRYYVATHERATFFTGGNARDLSYQILRQRLDPLVIFFNYTRTQEGKVSYTAIESIKDGLISSTKYEGGYRIFPHPHIVILANWLPDLNALSADRWKIFTICGDDHHAEQFNQ